jgi:L-asparaginase/Glu-tRNA(Gln) amidotransferase subunit D
MKRIAMIGTGGTIQNTDAGRLPVETLVDDIRRRYLGLRSLDTARLEFRDIMSSPSEAFSPADWLAIARAVQDVADAGGADGIVVTHGTYTVEETAYVLNLVIQTRVPIALAVSQVNHLEPGNDGDRNLIQSIAVISSPDARDRGVMVIQGGYIHAAREVRKDNWRPDGFSSGPTGVLGTLDADGPTFYRRTDRRHTFRSEFSIDMLERLPRVDIVAVYPGADRVAIDAYVAAGAQGIVIAGYPYTGVATADQMTALREADERGVMIAVASRGRSGRIPADASAWWVRSDDLSPQKARILLALSLSLTQTVERSARKREVQRLFDHY